MNDYNALLAFLRPFTEGSDGYIGLTRANRSEQETENKKWAEFHNWYAECAAGEIDLPESELNRYPDWEYYFTPAVLSEESRLQSKFQHSNCIWIDFDEPVEWQEFDPAPSIVVETSPGKKYHCYWFLNWQISNANDMRYWCKRFLQYFGQGDESGFDATQLLKLPWGKNLKLGARNMDGTPPSPRIIKFAPDLRYSEVAFQHMPEPTVDVDLNAIPDLPESNGGWQFYLESWRQSMSKELEQRIRNYADGGTEKRSGVLYGLIMDLFEVFDNPEDVYLLLLGSPNDKFTADYGPRGAGFLWKDVNRLAVKYQKRKANPALSKGLRDIIEDKTESQTQKVVNATAFVMGNLRETGGFIQTALGEAYYVDKRAEAVTLHMVNVDRTSPFASMIRRRFGLNEGAHKAVITGILHETVDECMQEKPVHFHNFGYYDEERNKVYVDRYDGYMYVLDGESIELHPHGYDKVYFYQNNDSEFPRPFEYMDGTPPGGLDALILDGPNYSTQGTGISRAELRHLLKTWVSSFFFPVRMDTKPIVLIHGAADSGKTTLFQNLSVMFTGDSTYSVTEIPSDVKEFNVQVTQSSYIFYDNVEVNRKEMQAKLAQVATGYTVKMRKLFTNNEMMSVKARSFVGITSRTIDRIQDDVATRYILIPVHPFKSNTENNTRRSMSDILKEVTSKRDELWSELLDFVNLILKEIDRNGWPDTSSQMRMADYANLLNITCGIKGLSPKKIEKFIMAMQAEIVSENDPIFAGLTKLIENPTHDPEKPYTSRELYEVLCRMHRKIQAQYGSLNKFTRAVNGYIDNGQLERAGILISTRSSGNNKSFLVSGIG